VLNKLPHAHPLVRQVNREAYLAYLEGRYFWNKRTEEGFSKAITLFKRSIEIDPTYAPPYAGLADCYELLGSAPYSTLSPKEAFPQAEAAARKALELDSTLAEAHVPLGYSQLVYEWNLPEAQKEFDKALRIAARICHRSPVLRLLPDGDGQAGRCDCGEKKSGGPGSDQSSVELGAGGSVLPRAAF
jgi:hypothetical protein